jgi:hypothetical protein
MPLSIHRLRTFFELPENYLFLFQSLYSSQNTLTHQKPFLCSPVILLNHFNMFPEVPLSEMEEEAQLSSKLDIDSQNKEAKPSFIQRLRTVIPKHLVGWKFGVTAWAVLVIVTLFINLGLSVLAIVGSNRGFDGTWTLLHGECSKISRYSVGANLIINVLSTLLLSGSNYCKQCLSAPTRREIDNAHKRGIALDIGIPSVRNLAVLGRWRVLMWILLGISSLPLHLLSVIPPSP